MMDSQRADFGLLMAQIGSPLGHKGVQEGLTLLKKEILKMQKQAIPICLKTRQAGSRLNRELWLKITTKRRIYDLSKKRWKLRRSIKMSRGHVGRKLKRSKLT